MLRRRQRSSNVAVDSDYNLSHILITIPETASARESTEIQENVNNISEQVQDGGLEVVDLPGLLLSTIPAWLVLAAGFVALGRDWMRGPRAGSAG